MAPAVTHIGANGLRVYYEVHGEEGEPLLLLHGGTATSRAWASHLPAFAEHFRVFAPDSRGHGRTDNPTGELLGYRAMADDVVAAALLGALGLRSPEYWKTSYVKQIASLWLTPLRYTSEDLAAVTDPVLILVGDRDGVLTEESVELFGLLPNAEL